MDKKNKFLNQDEINELLTSLEKNKTEDEIKAAERPRKIKIMDFKRPDIVGKGILRKMENIMKEFCLSLDKYFSSQLELPATAQVASLDQLTREEFVRCCTTPSFAASSRWLDGFLLLNMNPGTFLGEFLGRKPQKKKKKKYQELTGKKYYLEWKTPNAFEKNIFQQYIASPILERLEAAFQYRSEEKLEAMSDLKFDTNPLFLPYSEWSIEMGVMVTIELIFAHDAGGEDGEDVHTLDLFFNAPLIEALCKKNVIAEKETNKVIKLERPVGNTLVELGRCHLREDFKLEKYMVLELNSMADEPLSVYINGSECWKGDAVFIDDSKGVRICKASENTKAPDCTPAGASDFYNTRVILGWTSLPEDKVRGLGEGSIIELEQQWYEQVLIFKNNQLIAKGQVIVIDENFAVKIRELC